MGDLRGMSSYDAAPRRAAVYPLGSSLGLTRVDVARVASPVAGVQREALMPSKVPPVGRQLYGSSSMLEGWDCVRWLVIAAPSLP